jgi:hypothetical protein
MGVVGPHGHMITSPGDLKFIIWILEFFKEYAF